MTEQRDLQYEAYLIWKGKFDDNYWQKVGENVDLRYETFKAKQVRYERSRILDELNFIRLYEEDPEYDDEAVRVPMINDEKVKEFINKL